ncbi:Ig-like domain-containing protein [Brevundimonas lenta]|uniref:VCBS repeat-containing protein n=1 Tax=Brevundimonas lenta TaxID=424796 RepID=A0A7W6JH85_9CAUL|nr:cadherin-like domain-containing protein [Brevundimonas lenta]MBB4084087.1 VCBS repeat-containing protein [Brevundimonas lenta]
MDASNVEPVDAPVDLTDPEAVSVFPPPNVYSWDFTYGLGPWTTWLPPAVVTEPGGTFEQFTRLQAPGGLDANHIDGVGAIWLVAHLSTPTAGSPGVLNLTDAEFEMTVRGTDFLANGGKLAIWLCRYVPETGLMENFYVGLQVTNWANTGGDMAGQVTDDWSTITLRISSDPADWTYAGNYETFEGDWADRYQPFDLAQTLSRVDATLHLVVLNPDADNAPSGFLDLANITVRTQTPATPIGVSGLNPEIHYGLEDQVATGTLNAIDGIDLNNATFSLVGGSARNGTVTIDPATGAYTFTPPANYFGPTDAVGAATFRYTVTDGVTTSPPITVIVYIGGINDAPLISTRPENVNITADQPFEFTLFKGTDIDGDILKFELVDGSVTGGTLVLDVNSGHYTFTPTAGFTGAASFRYRMTDGHVDTAEKTVTLTVNAAASTPALPTFETVVNTYLLAGDMNNWVYYTTLLAYKGDPNASYHYATWLNSGINGVTMDKALARQFLEDAAGTVPDARLILSRLYTSGEGGARDYVHARELLATLPNDKEAIYRLAILDHLGLGAPVNDARAVQGYLKAALMGHGEAAFALGRRYLDGEGVGHSAEDAYFWLGVAQKLNPPPHHQQFDDLITFNQNEAALGLTPAQIIALNAAIAAWDPGEASPVNDAPQTSGADVVIDQVAPGRPVSGSLADAADPDGDAFSYVVVNGSTQNGTVTINPATGDFTFNPTPGFTGTVSFSYVVSDGRAASAPRTVSFQVEAGMGAAADDGGTNENTPLSVSAAAGLLANDYSPPAGGSFSVSAINGVGTNVGQPVSGTWGSLVVQANGSYVFTPFPGARMLQQGQVVTDTFTYTITNTAGVSSTASLTITINGLDGIVLSGSGTLIGSGFADEITGGDGYDVLIGNGGNDRLSGGAGAANELYGGLGNDTYILTVGDTIVENAGEGTDIVLTTLANHTLAANVENLTYTGTGAFIGSGNGLANTITGGFGADILIGLGGNDLLRGGAGAANELYGGAGDDTYLIAAAGDVIVEVAGEGVDTVQAALAAWTLAPNVENLTYTGTGDFTGVGNAGDNIINGGLGDDVLSGRGGVDRLSGGPGSDTASYAAAAGAVDVRLGAASVARNDGDGSNDILTGIENVTGSAFNDILIGDALGNVLSGGLGRDTLLGMDGNDTLIGGDGVANQLQGGRGDDRYIITAVGDSIIELAGEGNDSVQTTLTSFRLAAEIENLTYTGTGDFTGMGSATGNVITGGVGRDLLLGYGGNDVLSGGTGAANELYGGIGDDTYIVQVAGDTIVEVAGEGFDTVRTTLAAYTLRNEVEALVYTGTGDFTGTGNAGANVITGGDGSDILIGRGGIDQLIGGAGSDTASYANAAARVDVRLNAGAAINDGDGATDTLNGIENLVGSAFDDLLVGDNGANVLTGGLGRDTLLGMGGNDRLIGGSGVANQLQGGTGDDTYVLTIADTVVELAGEGNDTIETTLAAYTLGANVENLLYTGTGNFAGTGNALDNVIRGGLGNDTFKGGAGNDTLFGGGGTNVALLTGLQAEYQFQSLGAGVWRVTDTVAGRDGVDLLYDITNVRFGNGATVALGLMAPPATLLDAKDVAPLVLPEEPAWLSGLHEPRPTPTLDDIGLDFRPHSLGDWF